MCRSGRPAWYWRQSQIENGESRRTCQLTVRFQNSCVAATGCGSSSRIENAASVTTTNPATKTAFALGRRSASGYEAQSGPTTSGANFVQPDSATAAPRANGEVTSQKPQIRKSGGSASFVFELETYCVNGYAAQANASVAASRGPPKRSPTSARPSRQSRSKPTEARC